VNVKVKRGVKLYFFGSFPMDMNAKIMEKARGDKMRPQSYEARRRRIYCHAKTIKAQILDLLLILIGQ